MAREELDRIEIRVTIHSNAEDEDEIKPDKPEVGEVEDMVVDAHTVVDPYAMTVVSLNTLVTDGAVLGSRSLDDLTLGTHVLRVDILKQLQEGEGLGVRFNISWFLDD
jgi:hypothetical protein